MSLLIVALAGLRCSVALIRNHGDADLVVLAPPLVGIVATTYRRLRGNPRVSQSVSA